MKNDFFKVVAIFPLILFSPLFALEALAGKPPAANGIQWLPQNVDDWTPVAESVARIISIEAPLGEIQLDGKLLEPAWSTAPKAGKFELARGGGEETLDWADVRFLASESGLVVGAFLKAPPNGPVAKVQSNGGRVWRDHALEIELSPVAGQDSIKVIVNANGVHYSQQGSKPWAGTVTSAASLDGTSAWQAEG